MAERTGVPEQRSEAEEAKIRFKGDYANEFCKFDLALQAMQSEMMNLDQFADFCQRFFNKDLKKHVLKFSEKYNLPVPEMYKTEVEEIDGLTDEINAWVEDFLKNPVSEKIPVLAVLTKKCFTIIKEAK